MYLVIPHSTPHTALLALPLGSFRAKFREATETDEAQLELVDVFSGQPLAALSGDAAIDAWEDIEAHANAGDVLTADAPELPNPLGPTGEPTA